MTKNEYLAILYEHLKNMSETEKQDIVSEYENHFIEGLNDGKTEQQIVKMLGHPKDMAKAINTESAVGEAEKHKGLSNTGQAIITVLGLSIINFILITGPLLIYIGLLISLAFVGLIGLAAPFLVFYQQKFTTAPVLISDWFAAIGWLGLGIMLAVLTIVIVKWSYLMIIKYLKWNIQLIKRGNQS